MTPVFLAGIGNSGPTHWQSIWFRAAKPAHWVEHADWDTVSCARWVEELNSALASISGPKLLVGHSLGCILALEWAKRHHDPDVAGAFLVAVPDVEGPKFPAEATGFASAIGAHLPFPAIMIASSNDPYSTPEYARELAAQWKIELVPIGDRGHINADSQLGEWPEGKQIFENFAASLRSVS
jgi:uncharacterized protein